MSYVFFSPSIGLLTDKLYKKCNNTIWHTVLLRRELGLLPNCRTLNMCGDDSQKDFPPIRKKKSNKHSADVQENHP